jgi:hypothetical protein
MFMGSVSRIRRTGLHTILVLCDFGVGLVVVTYLVNVHFIKIDRVNRRMRYLIFHSKNNEEQGKNEK